MQAVSMSSAARAELYVNPAYNLLLPIPLHEAAFCKLHSWSWCTSHTFKWKHQHVRSQGSKMWLCDTKAIERCSFCMTGELDSCLYGCCHFYPEAIYNTHIYICINWNARMASVCQTQCPGARRQCLGKGIKTKIVFLVIFSQYFCD